MRGLPLSHQLAPVFDHLGAVAVDLEPGERLVEGRAVEQSPLRAIRSLDVEQPLLQHQYLLQAFDVAPGDWEQAELDAAFERISREALTAPDQPERLQQRAGEDGIGQRIRSVVKPRESFRSRQVKTCKASRAGPASTSLNFRL